MNKTPVEISIVIPVYSSEDCLETLIERLTEILNSLNQTYEIIMINDCSPDMSWDKIVHLSKNYRNIIGIDLRRNFGQHNAIMAGLHYSSGKFIVIMDDDLQHDPIYIPALLTKLADGYDVCYACYQLKKHSWFKNLGSWFNDKVANIVLKKPKKIYLSSYKAIQCEVVDEILKYNGPHPYIDGLLFTITRNVTQIYVEHHERFSGKGHYTLRKSLNLWLKLATAFSILPLRAAIFLGFFSSAIGFFLALYFIIRYFAGIHTPAGWPSLIVTVLFLGGIQLISLGIIGEYVGRLFLHQRKEPQFTVNKVINSSGK
ncbi:glycosyltransferase family 2 protein [bacterium]|nr:glycosyltransferase family 2 protein [bacterium]